MADMQKAFKYRLYPTEEQARVLDTHFYLCRKLYNAALEERITWHKNGAKISYTIQAKELPELKANLTEYQGVHSQVLQDVLRRVDKAYKNFFRRCKEKKSKAGFPRFKGRNRFKSITYPQSGFSIEGRNLKLMKFGKIRLVYHRPIEGKIKALTIKRDSVGDWWATFSCELPDVPTKEPKTAIGVDVGLEKLVTLSTGESIEPPKFLRKSERDIEVLSRKLSRTEKRSKRREKARIKLARAHRRIENQRNDFLHKLSRGLIENTDLIAFEDLSIQNMQKNHCLSKSIADASWGKLIKMTRYKAESAGGAVVLVDPRGTSILCSRCGAAVPKRLDQRLHVCQDCGFELDRDWNAALNILKRVGPDGAELLNKRLVEAIPLSSPSGGGKYGP